MKLSVLAESIIVIFISCAAFGAKANLLPDEDNDMVPDRDEIEIYKTNPRNSDTDGDGFSDWLELNNGFSPHAPGSIKLEKNDFDKDGLNDSLELKFKTDLSDFDTDNDGFSDGQEIKSGFDPLDPSAGKKLEKRIEINTGPEQTLGYFLGGVRLKKFSVSTGKVSMPTPKGEFSVLNKSKKAWSGTYGLWMPFWLGLGNFGIHELPFWPNGYREGEDHLGKAVSHGCIRLGIGPAEELFNWAEAGVKVHIY